jgi:hypothetical protein
MTVTAALLVDSVRQREDGAIDLVGLVEGFSFPSLPVSVEELLLFLRLSLDDADRGRSVRLTFHLLSPDGKERSEPQVLGFTVPTRDEHPARDATLLPQLTLSFHQGGPHTLEIRRDGSPLLALPMMVYDAPL